MTWVCLSVFIYIWRRWSNQITGTPKRRKYVERIAAFQWCRVLESNENRAIYTFMRTYNLWRQTRSQRNLMKEIIDFLPSADNWHVLLFLHDQYLTKTSADSPIEEIIGFLSSSGWRRIDCKLKVVVHLLASRLKGRHNEIYFHHRWFGRIFTQLFLT